MSRSGQRRGQHPACSPPETGSRNHPWPRANPWATSTWQVSSPADTSFMGRRSSGVDRGARPIVKLLEAALTGNWRAARSCPGAGAVAPGSGSYPCRVSRYGKRPDLVVHEEEPFNAETGLAALAEGPLTATDAFYVRGARRGAADRRRRLAASRPRAGRAGARPLTRHPARRVHGARGHRDAAMRRQQARRPDRDPRHPGRGAMGSRRYRYGDVDRRCARRRARARRPAVGGRPRRLRRRRRLRGGEARSVLRWFDPAR